MEEKPIDTLKYYEKRVADMGYVFVITKETTIKKRGPPRGKRIIKGQKDEIYYNKSQIQRFRGKDNV